MASCTSTFGEADYGCATQGSLTASYTVIPVNFAISPDDPSQAIITLSCKSELTINNVNYDTSTNQDVSAWLNLSSPLSPLVESNKTFVPRQNCITTTNSLTSNVDMLISAGDTIRAKGKWSGFEDQQSGLDVPNCDWFDVELGDSYTITPPQNLQVTFPDKIDGEISYSIASWSMNPNITGVPFSPVGENGDISYNNWNWKVEVLDKNGIAVTSKTYSLAPTLTGTLTADTEGLLPNSSYTMRVTASNSMQAATAVTSPVIDVPPLAPFINHYEVKPWSGYYYVDFNYAQSSSGDGEVVRLTMDYNGNVTILGDTSYGNDINGTASVNYLGAAQKVSVVFTASSTHGESSTTVTFYTPAIPPTITTAWDETRKCVTISATSENITDFNITAGYMRGGTSLADQTEGNSLELCDLDHGNGEVLYVTATPKLPDHTYDDYATTMTIPILNPILGLSKTCDKTLNIVDIVEVKDDGTVTPQWQTGERVKPVTCDVPPEGNGIGIYNVAMTGHDLTSNGLANWEIMFNFTPDTDLSKAEIILHRSAHVPATTTEYSTTINGIVFNVSIVGRKVSIWVNNFNSQEPQKYRFQILVQPDINVKRGVTLGNISNALAFGSDVAQVVDGVPIPPKYDYMYRVVNNALVPLNYAITVSYKCFADNKTVALQDLNSSYVSCN